MAQMNNLASDFTRKFRSDLTKVDIYLWVTEAQHASKKCGYINETTL
jgi:hypothetical protein